MRFWVTKSDELRPECCLACRLGVTRLVVEIYLNSIGINDVHKPSDTAHLHVVRSEYFGIHALGGQL